MKSKQSGFTLVELLIGIIGITTLGLACTAIFVGFHFISKFW